MRNYWKLWFVLLILLSLGYIVCRGDLGSPFLCVYGFVVPQNRFALCGFYFG